MVLEKLPGTARTRQQSGVKPVADKSHAN